MKGSNFEKFFQNFTAAISKPIPARAGVRGHWQCNGSCDPAPDIFTQLTGDPVICPDVARPRDILLAPVPASVKHPHVLLWCECCVELEKGPSEGS